MCCPTQAEQWIAFLKDEDTVKRAQQHSATSRVVKESESNVRGYGYCGAFRITEQSFTHLHTLN